MDAIFEVPRSVFGAGALSRLGTELQALGGKRPFLVTDQGLMATGQVDRARETLPSCTVVFSDVTPNPVFADVDAARERYLAHDCDSVIALGGGSVLDVAKYIALLATHGGTLRDYVGRPEPFWRPAAPLIAVPSTAGTGSEASPDAGIHPDIRTASVGISSRWAVPSVALLDPQLTIGLPAILTAATGIDALTHCIEGFLSTTNSAVGDTLALEGIRLVEKSIERATNAGADLSARGDMMLAGYLGGVAIGMGLGPAHAIAIACGDQGLHHGLLSGIGCVATLDRVLAHTPEKRTALCTALHLDISHSPSLHLAAMMRRLDLPATLCEAGYRPLDLAAISKAASQSQFNLRSRWRPDAKTYQKMIESSLSGDMPEPQTY